jgi:hypothetical protein
MPEETDPIAVKATRLSGSFWVFLEWFNSIKHHFLTI